MFAQMPALILSVVSTSAVTTTTFWNQWSVSGPSSSGVLGPIWAWRSLFEECMQYQGGQSQCQGQDSMFLEPGYKIVLRALMIMSVILSVLACVGILVGMECTRILEDNRNLKRRIMFVCGLLNAATAIFTFTSVTWYTFKIHREFFAFESQDNMIQWELGACVYLGFVASFLSVVSFLACCCSPGPRQEEDDEYKYRPNLFVPVKSTSRDDFKIADKETHKYMDYV